MTREELIEKYEWREGEREQVIREMAERQRAIDAERILSEAHTTGRNSRALEFSTKDYLPPRQANRKNSSDFADDQTKQWESHIERRIAAKIAAHQQILLRAVATVMAEQDREHETLAAELGGMRDRVKQLETELDEMRRQAELRETLDGIAERLDRIEARTSPMKVVSGAVGRSPPFESGTGGSLIG